MYLWEMHKCYIWYQNTVGQNSSEMKYNKSDFVVMY